MKVRVEMVTNLPGTAYWNGLCWDHVTVFPNGGTFCGRGSRRIYVNIPGNEFYVRFRSDGWPSFNSGFNLTFTLLKDDVWFFIFRYLSPGALCKLCRVCKCLRQLASEDCVWLPHEKDCVLMRSADSRRGRSSSFLKEQCRVSRNWETAHRREFWLLRYNNRLLPWLQRSEDTLLVSKGNIIQQFAVQPSGFLQERCRAALTGLRTDVTRFVVNNGIVVAGCRDGGVSTWEAASGVQLLHHRDAHSSDTQCVQVVGSAIVSASKDKTVKVLSMYPDDTEREKTCFNVGDRVWSLAASPDGSTVAVGTACHDNPAVCLLDVNSGEFLGHLEDHLKRGFGVLDMKFESPHLLLTCGHDTYLRLWDLRTRSCVNKWEDQFDSTVYCLQSDGHNTMLTGTARHGLVRLWDKRQPENLQIYNSGDQNSPVYSMVATSRHLYLAMDLGLDLVDFSLR
ncbi:hypothetical protein ACOMHN_035848 [Nucella lapillus]